MLKKTFSVNRIFYPLGKRSTCTTSLAVVAISVSFFLTSCHKSDDKGAEQPAAYTLKGNSIILPEHSNILPQLKLTTIQQEDFAVELNTAGAVKAIPNTYAEIAPPFSGRILRSFVRLGQQVAPGTPMFEISSPDYFNAQKDYADARQELRQSELNLSRQRDLVKHGVGIQRELEEAETEYNVRKSAVTNTAAALKIFNAYSSNASIGKPLVVVSPIRGEVVTNNIIIGQYLKDDAEPLALVAELSKVWVAAQIKEKDIALISKLKEAEIQAAAFPGRSIRGKIYHVNEMVNDETRSVEVLIECENKDRSLKPGMYVTALFKDAPTSVILVSEKGVFQKEDQQFVFVKTSANTFEKRTVQTAAGANGKLLITSGLKTGDIIVSEGGSLMLRNY